VARMEKRRGAGAGGKSPHRRPRHRQASNIRSYLNEIT